MSAGVFTTGSAPKLLWPGLNKIFIDNYQAHLTEWDKLFDQSPSDKNYEEDVMMSTFGYVPVLPQGARVQYDTMKQFFVTRYTHITYALGFIISKEAMEDNQYMDMGTKGAKALSWSYNQTREIIAHDVYNDGFSGGPTYGDGKVFFATDHPLDQGAGTFSNVLNPAADLSEASLEDLLIQISNAVDNRGLKMNLIASSLHVPTALQFEAKRILGDKRDTLHARPGTADRDISAMYFMDMFPKGLFVHHYFDDPDAYFIRTNLQDAVRYFNRIDVGFTEDNEFDTENMRYKCRGRYSVGVTDPRGGYASPGA